MEFQPLESRLLVEVVETEQKTASGIIIPDNAKEKPNKAKVVAVGPYVKSVKENDTILFGKYSGTEIELDGKNYLILEIKDVLGILK